MAVFAKKKQKLPVHHRDSGSFGIKMPQKQDKLPESLDRFKKKMRYNWKSVGHYEANSLTCQDNEQLDNVPNHLLSGEFILMEQNDAPIEEGAMPEIQEEENMADLLEQEGLGIDFPKRGEIRDGIIASVSAGQILISVGAKSEGVVAGKEYDLIPPRRIRST